MPVKEKVNKSEEVRKLHKSGVKSASEIMAKLKARGITIAPAQVYQVLSHKKGKKKNKTKAAEHSEEKETVVDHAVVFVKAAGGMQKARELLSKLALLKN
jgi:Fe2+ or Zn2+ uptake regulation protein